MNDKDLNKQVKNQEIKNPVETKLSTNPVVSTKPPETTGEPSNAPVIKTIEDTRDDNLGFSQGNVKVEDSHLAEQLETAKISGDSVDLSDISEKDVEFVEEEDLENNFELELQDRETDLENMKKDHQKLTSMIEESEKELEEVRVKNQQAKKGTFFVYDRDTIVEAEILDDGDNGVEGAKHLQVSVGGKSFIYKNVRPGDARVKEVGTFFEK